MGRKQQKISDEYLFGKIVCQIFLIEGKKIASFSSFPIKDSRLSKEGVRRKRGILDAIFLIKIKRKLSPEILHWQELK